MNYSNVLMFYNSYSVCCSTSTCLILVQVIKYMLCDCVYMLVNAIAICTCMWTGAGIAQWLEHRTRDRKVAGSTPCWSGGRFFFSRVNFLCWLISVSVPPRATAVARKRRWQVTAKHAHTLRMWLCMKWHGAWLYGVHTERARWQQFHVAPAMPSL